MAYLRHNPHIPPIEPENGAHAATEASPSSVGDQTIGDIVRAWYGYHEPEPTRAIRTSDASLRFQASLSLHQDIVDALVHFNYDSSQSDRRRSLPPHVLYPLAEYLVRWLSEYRPGPRDR